MWLEIIVNSCAWLAIQVALIFIANCIPRRLFAVRAQVWERNGRTYELLGIRRWKDKLPEAGARFGNGFSKRNLRGRGRGELVRFAREARRGELVHWCAIAALPLFALWNTPLGMLVNAIYSVAANFPCIIVQRYNRARIVHLLKVGAGYKTQTLLVRSRT